MCLSVQPSWILPPSHQNIHFQWRCLTKCTGAFTPTTRLQDVGWYEDVRCKMSLPDTAGLNADAKERVSSKLAATKWLGEKLRFCHTLLTNFTSLLQNITHELCCKAHIFRSPFLFYTPSMWFVCGARTHKPQNTWLPPKSSFSCFVLYFFLSCRAIMIAVGEQ